MRQLTNKASHQRTRGQVVFIWENLLEAIRISENQQNQRGYHDFIIRYPYYDLIIVGSI